MSIQAMPRADVGFSASGEGAGPPQNDPVFEGPFMAIRFVAGWPKRIGNGRALAHYAGLRPAKLEMDESVLRELAMG
jgi:hypothetical protein